MSQISYKPGFNGASTGNIIGNGNISNPFRTKDSVEFEAVTASYFIGDGSHISGITSSNMPLFSEDVRKQISAGTGIAYDVNTGIVSSTGVTSISATYKTTISGSYGVTTTGVFFTTEASRGKFIPYNCMFHPTSGDLSAGPDISVGISGSDFNGNDLAVNTSIGNMVVGNEFVEIPIQTSNGSGLGKNRVAAANSKITWKMEGFGIGTQITGTLILSGYYLNS